MDVKYVTDTLTEIDSLDHLAMGMPPEELRRKIDALKIPIDLRYLFSDHWPQTPGQAGLNNYVIKTSAQILSPENQSLVNQCLIGIGNSGCGNTLVVNFGSDPYTIDELDYEYEWSDQPPANHLTRVSDTIESFLQSALKMLQTDNPGNAG